MLRLVALAVGLLALAVADSQAQSAPAMTSVRVASGLSQPVMVTHAAGDRSRLFIVEKQGRIKILRDGAVLATPFLDISDLVAATGESGCLSVAFAPDFATTRVFYVFYTRRGGVVGGTAVDSGSVIARFHAAANNPDIADPASQELVYFAARGAGIHNGGWMGFSPDGMLWVSLGEAGTSANSQNLGVAHGKMLRMDVTAGAGADGGAGDDFPDDPNRNFRVPAGNPFVATAGALPEIYAYGLRNPWRCSIDAITGDVWIGDVGGGTNGEVDVLPAGSAGQNFGWPCFDSLTPQSNISNCGGNASLITQGIWTYARSLGNAITGGYVYRGCANPSVKGLYFFADYGGGRVWTLAYTPGVPVAEADVIDRTTELRPAGTNTGFSSFSAFGEDADGELYLVNVGGSIFKIVPRPGTFRDVNANGIPDGCEAPFCGVADVASLGGAIAPDNQLTADDLVAFLAAFFAGTVSVADIAQIGGTLGPDGTITPDDLIAYLTAFFAGCP